MASEGAVYSGLVQVVHHGAERLVAGSAALMRVLVGRKTCLTLYFNFWLDIRGLSVIMTLAVRVDTDELRLT